MEETTQENKENKIKFGLILDQLKGEVFYLIWQLF